MIGFVVVVWKVKKGIIEAEDNKKGSLIFLCKRPACCSISFKLLHEKDRRYFFKFWLKVFGELFKKSPLNPETLLQPAKIIKG